MEIIFYFLWVKEANYTIFFINKTRVKTYGICKACSMVTSLRVSSFSVFFSILPFESVWERCSLPPSASIIPFFCHATFTMLIASFLLFFLQWTVRSLNIGIALIFLPPGVLLPRVMQGHRQCLFSKWMCQWQITVPRTWDYCALRCPS
jgi:hypothetical protein